MKQGIHIGTNRQIIVCLHIFVDYLAIIAAEHTALWLQAMFREDASRAMVMPWEYQYVYYPLLLLLVMFQSDGYRFNRPSLDVTRDVFKGACYGFLMYMLVIFLMRNRLQVSRYYTGCFLLFSMAYIAIGRYMLGKFVLQLECLQERILLVGAGRTAERLLEAFADDPCYGYKVVGMLDDHPISNKLPQKYPLLGGFKDAASVIKEQGVRTIVIAAPGLSEERMRKLLVSVQHLTDTILFTPSLVGTPLGSVEISTLFVEQLTIIKSKNNLSRWSNRATKFVFDMVVTFFGCILISPFFILLSLLVGIDNKRRIFFAHRRVGRNGKEFDCYKFQTMVPNASEALKKYLAENPAAQKEWDENFKLTHDPRVTKLGAFLRRTSLDELPQVFNVLKGEMSLVGPRPIVQGEVCKYGDNIREYYMVRPGITGMWQTSGRSDTTYEERVEMDTWYVRNWSVWLDMKYLVKTFKAVLEKRGAY